jgi:hypothetical protein
MTWVLSFKMYTKENKPYLLSFSDEGYGANTFASGGATFPRHKGTFTGTVMLLPEAGRSFHSQEE